MLDKFIKEVVGIVVGHQIDKINTILKKDKYTNEFLIAKKLDIPVNHTRTFLYKLLEFGLVSSLREKDEKKGFYIYSWKLNALKCLEFLKKILEKNMKKLEDLKERKSHEQTYKCKRCIREVSVEDALTNDFYCIECGGLLEVNEGVRIVDGINRKLIILKSKLDLVEEEIKKLREKLSLKEKKELEENTKSKNKKTPIKKERTSKKGSNVVKKKVVKKPIKKKVVKKSVKKSLTKKKVIVKKPVKKKVVKKSSVKKKPVKKSLTKKKVIVKKPVKKKVVKKSSVKKKIAKNKVGLFSNIFKK